MSVLNIFKKKKISKKTEKEKQSSSSSSILSSAKTTKDKKTTEGKKAAKGRDEKKSIVFEDASSLLLIKPYLSEKFTFLREQQNKYIFEVDYKATKSQIKKLLEKIYNVEVTKLNVVNASAKPKRWRQKKSYQRRNKKVIATLKNGQKIELGI